MLSSFSVTGLHGPIRVNAWGMRGSRYEFGAGSQEARIRSQELPRLKDGGLPVVALHGFIGSGLDFAPVVNALPDAAIWVAIDLPGHGLSYCGDVIECYTLESCMDNLDTVLKYLGIDQCCLLGYSMGGRLALHYASRNPERLADLILVSASPGLAEAKARAERRERDACLAQSLCDDGVRTFLQKWQQLPLIQSQQDIPARIRMPMQERRMANRAQGLALSLRGMGTGVLPALWHELGGISVKTCLVSGAKDQKFTAIARAMAAQLPEAEHVMIDGAGHMPHLEKVESFVREVGLGER